MEHQIVYQRTKSHDQSSNHPTVWLSKKGNRNVKSDANSGCPDVQGHLMSMSKMFELSTSITEEESPDHGEWDTDEM